MMCRIGRGIPYCDGISPKGKEYYDNFLSMLSDKYAPHAMAILTHYEIQRKLDKEICRTQVKIILTNIKQNIVNERLIECMDYLINKIETNGKCVNETAFKKLSAEYISW